MRTPGKVIRSHAWLRPDARAAPSAGPRTSMAYAVRPGPRARYVGRVADLIDKIAWIHLEQRRLLVARNAGRDRFYLPGGKREPGESDVETLVRELDEELAV